MTRESYPYLKPQLPGADARTFLPLLALKPPPLPKDLPPHPAPHRIPTWIPSGWLYSSHILPGAYPRICSESVLPDLQFDATLTRDGRRDKLIDSAMQLEKMLDEEMKQWPRPRDQLLWICMDRYVKKERDGKGITLFLAHANGFNKETWEPMLKYLLARDQTISEIWVWESVNNGDSALLNEGKLNSMFHWHEFVRDILQFMIYYLPSEVTTKLPLHVPRLAESNYGLRCAQGLTSRKLTMVGHSFGGTVCTLAAIAQPSLFSSLFLIDPVIVIPQPHGYTLTVGALGRKYQWKSKEELLAQMQESPFFRRWDPDVFKAYINHGLCATPDGAVRLKMLPVHEAIMFSNSRTGADEAYVRLYRGELDERIELRWLVPGRGEAELGGPGQTHSRVWLRKANSSNVLIDGAGHLITHEKPRAVADELAEFVRRKYGGTQSKL